MSAAAPQTIDREGKYRIGPKLGAGGMAEVFIGSTVGASGFSRTVVLKRILPEWSNNEQFASMFINEAHLASLLHHPNIVAMHLLDRDPDGNLFQVLEYVEGRDLEKLCSVGPIPIPVTVYVISAVLRGLDHAHSARNPSNGRPLGMVHRDCTPSNVLLDYAGNVKVSDFGVAKAVLATNATQSGTAKGKPGYMSPEQLRGMELDGRSDLFAVGVMFWELLAGYRLFNGDTLPAIITQVLEYERGAVQIPAIHTVNAAVSPELARVVHQLLAADRSQRPTRASEALALLRPWIPADGAEQLAQLLATRFPRQTVSESSDAGMPATMQMRGPGGTPIAVPSPTPPALGQVAAAATGNSPPVVPKSRRRGLLLGIAGVAMVSAGVVVGVAMSGGGRAPAVSGAANAPLDAGVFVDALPLDAPSSDASESGLSATAPPVDAAVAGSADDSAGVDAGRRSSSRRSRLDAGRQEIIEYDLEGSGK